MRVLVSEAAPGDAVEVLGRLCAADHTVVPCRGGERCPLAVDGTCPLADELVDVVVHVRARPDGLSDHAARPTSGAARKRVERAVAEVLRPHRLAPPRRVHITVGHGVVDVALTFDRRLPLIVREQLRPAVRSALAAFSPYWAYARVAVLADVPVTSESGRFG